MYKCYNRIKDLILCSSIPKHWECSNFKTVLSSDLVKPQGRAIIDPQGTNSHFSSDDAQQFSYIPSQGFFLYFGKKIPFETFTECMLDYQKDCSKFLEPSKGYLLCRLSRQRLHGRLPCRYTLRLDNSREILIEAFKKRNHSITQIFKPSYNGKYCECAFAKFTNTEMCSSQEQENGMGGEYLGCIEKNIWGTLFTVFDGGVSNSFSENAETRLWPHFVRKAITTIRFHSNFFGESPRHLAVTIDQRGLLC
ncbi:hypothetical protein IE077_003665 [Cardiosporidium cionae]|uniref:Uncharacterized protein n=1 Tax=Cardiosporidium cionae TaxID=476202 RepID=A0ABQ7J7R2_9APIC|nr:hypothetical protein IE077_003665 [Cardiosporidium cionae]|eukprot:KAF8820029.1 hypothetical protein IE077_003665 [Cardiosporidium cionae]